MHLRGYMRQNAIHHLKKGFRIFSIGTRYSLHFWRFRATFLAMINVSSGICIWHIWYWCVVLSVTQKCSPLIHLCVYFNAHRRKVFNILKKLVSPGDATISCQFDLGTYRTKHCKDGTQNDWSTSSSWLANINKRKNHAYRYNTNADFQYQSLLRRNLHYLHVHITSIIHSIDPCIIKAYWNIMSIQWNMLVSNWWCQYVRTKLT